MGERLFAGGRSGFDYKSRSHLFRQRSRRQRPTFAPPRPTGRCIHSTFKIRIYPVFRSITILTFVVMAWFSPWWLGDRVLAPLDLQNLMMSPWRGANASEFAKNHIVSDGVDQYLVYRMVAAENLAREGRIGWSSLTYGGTAEYANTMALYYDWTMQLHRWLDFWTAWHVGLMGQVMLAAIGMFLFLRGRSISQVWACCGALAYAANSQFVTWIFHRWSLGAFCWVPWILWAIDAHRRGRRGFGAAVPVFIALAFLGGTLQHAALVVLAVVAMWLEETLGTRKRSGPVAAVCDRGWFSRLLKSDGRRPPLQLQFLLLGRYLVWGLLGSGLAAMMLLPCIDAFLTSNRLGLHAGMTTNVENSIYPHGPLQPLFNLAAYPFQVFPSLLGRCGSVDLLKLFKSELFYVVYFGSLPVWIAYLAFWRKDSPLLARTLIGMGLLLPLTPLVRLLYQRLFLLFIIGGILAFVHFMEKASRQTKLKVFRITAVITGIAAFAWTSVSVILAVRQDLGDMLREKIVSQGGGGSFGFFSDWIALRADRFVGDLSIWSPQQLFPALLFVAALLGFRWTSARNHHWRNRGAWLVTAAVLGEVSLFGARWVVWSDPQQHPMFPETAESRALKEHVGRDGRVTTLIHPTAHMAMTPFIPNTLSAYGIATITGYDSIVPNGMILPNETPGDAAKLGRLGVSHLITWQGNPEVPEEWKRVWASNSMELYENPFKVSRYIGFAGTETKDRFFEGARVGWVTLVESTGMENHRLIEVPSGVSWIRVAENHAEGWEYRLATDDGAWLPVLRADDISMLLENPSPDMACRIEMRYDPPMRRLGCWISGGSLILVGGMAAGSTRKRGEKRLQA